MARFYQTMDMPTMMITTIHKWRLMASFFCFAIPQVFAAQNTAVATEATAKPAAQVPAAVSTDAAIGFKPFEANYQILRSGKKHGEASRYLKRDGVGYELGYNSKISWLVFKDERKERSRFVIEQGRLKPSHYLMQRSGTGPSRHYELSLDWAQKQLKTEKKQVVKQIPWNDQWLDMLSFHGQIVLDIQQGKTDFVYDVLNRHGENRTYKYKVATEEWLSLPYGKVKAIRIERYGQGPDKQVYAWLAPELDYLLVRLWQSEDDVEQFDVQLSQYQPQ
jgi:hypothetical protein